MHTPQKAADSEGTPGEILCDLAAILTGDQAVYLKLGPEGAILSVKGTETFAFGEAIERPWHEMTSEERAEAVLRWIRKAAEYCRNPRVRWVPA